MLVSVTITIGNHHRSNNNNNIDDWIMTKTATTSTSWSKKKKKNKKLGCYSRAWFFSDFYISFSFLCRKKFHSLSCLLVFTHSMICCCWCLLNFFFIFCSSTSYINIDSSFSFVFNEWTRNLKFFFYVDMIMKNFRKINSVMFK